MVSVAILTHAAASEPPPSAAVPTSQPTAASTDRKAQIASWVAGLDSESGAVRERSYRSLLTLRRGDLPTLLEVSKAASPLTPGAALSLRLAVPHIFLTGQSYESSNKGALFIMLKSKPLFPPATAPGPDDVLRPQPVAISVEECKPGLCGYEFLEPGDIILGIGSQGGFMDADMLGAVPGSLSDAIKNAGAGSKMALRVLRRGVVQKIEVTLSRRGPQLDAAAQPTLVEPSWLRPAVEYWAKTFAPALNEPVPLQESWE